MCMSCGKSSTKKTTSSSKAKMYGGTIRQSNTSAYGKPKVRISFAKKRT